MSVASRRTPAKPPISTDEQKARLASLDTPLFLDQLPRTRLPRLEHAVRLLRRLRETQRPANIFASSFSTFRTRLCYTRDESRLETRRIPDWPYLRDLDDDLIERSPLMVEKSRRVLASWALCAFDVWVALGGQDPRWPSLMRGSGNRQVIIIAQRLEEAGGSAWYLESRVKFILDEIESRGLRKFWPDMPTWTARFGRIEFSNGSRIDALPSGADQVRGLTCTLAHCEEVAFWPLARPTINALLPALRGGGHIVCVTTASAGSWADELLSDTLDRGYRR